VRPRALAVTWILVAAVFLVLLFFEFSKWRSLSTEVSRAGAERQRLTAEIQIKEGQLVSEMHKHSTLVQEMQWTAAGADPSAFLTRLAELAREKRMMVMAIGALERQSAPQFTKSWHSIQVRAPYREIRELAARVEQDRGILEDVHLEAVRPDQRPASEDEPRRGEEVLARFKLTSLELSAQAKQMVERTLAASGGPPKAAPAPPLALPVPTTGAPPSAAGRDPFSFLTPPAPPRPPVVAGPGPEPARADLDLKGIVSFPDGFLAIVNNQIVKVGDTVSGHRVERITENAVTLREPGAATARTVDLPEMAPAAPPTPRR
jgi:hypothetical protein